MNAVVDMPAPSIVPRSGRNSVSEVTQHAIAVQEVMRAVMKEGVHYGTIPGAGDKPTLLKAGAEVLCMTFRIADEYEVKDMSVDGMIRYQITCLGRHQVTDIKLGSGMGECSSHEEKYKWRKAVCREEFEATPADMRRIKYGRKSNGFYTVEQVRTEPADLANTVLKMACKRAKIAMVLNVTSASDMFSQDLDDLDAELVRHLTEDEREEHAQTVRAEWIAKAKTTKTTDALQAVMREGVKVFQAARDRDGYAAFASAVQAHGATLKANQSGAANA